MQTGYRSQWTARWIALLLMFAVMAATGTAAYGETWGDFSINAVIPENQVDTNQTYFDLRVKPGEEQDLQVVITNSKDEALTAQVSVNDASTGRNGLIVYTKVDARDEMMELAVTDVASPLIQEVTVPPRGSETVTIRIKMPEQSFDGVLLGGIAVTGQTNESGEEGETGGVSLENTITYVTALKLTENDQQNTPDFELVSVSPELVNYKTAVVVDLRNKAPRIVKGMEVEANVYRKDSQEALHSLSLSQAEMAPLSQGSFVIDWEGQKLDPGTYRLAMKAVYEGRVWEWDEEFTIAGEAQALNNEAVGLQKNNTWIYLLWGAVLLALVFALAYWLGRRQKAHGGQQH